jgi:peptide/nickel transport system permease protein
MSGALPDAPQRPGSQEPRDEARAPRVGDGRGRAWPRRLLRTDRQIAAALSILGALVIMAVLGPTLWRHSPTATYLADSLAAPSTAHPMGTDSNGRDIFARFIRGAGISISAGAAVVFVGALLGGALGLVAGLARGIVDSVAMRVMDALLAFPALILAMAITIGLGVGIVSACAGLVLSTIPWYARLIRSEVLRVSQLPFIEAARAVGAAPGRIARRHVVPHVMPTLLVQAAGAFGYSIVALAALGFIGVGAQIPTPEWGAMITDGLPYTLTGQWWISVCPGLGLMLLVVAANLLADRVRDVLDPRGGYAR